MCFFWFTPQRKNKIQSHFLSCRQIRSLEDSLENTKAEYGQQLGPLSQVIVDLEANLKEVKSQVEMQTETNKNLLCVKMKLEQEINSYEGLILGITANADG